MTSLCRALVGASVVAGIKTWAEKNRKEKLASSVFWAILLDERVNNITVEGKETCVTILKTGMAERLRALTSPEATNASLCVDFDRKPVMVIKMRTDAGSALSTSASQCITEYVDAVASDLYDRKVELCEVLSSSSPVTVGLIALAALVIRVL